MKYYLTTSIIYTNGPPHIGFALELVQADALARYHRLQEKDVFFLTGTDENGLKNKKTAQDLGISPQVLVDQNSNQVKNLIKSLDISNDDFIRTTDRKRHWPAVQKVWQLLQQQGDLYKKSYEGLYCSGCEAFLTKRDLDKEGRCLIHNKKPVKVKEENYFFKITKYADKVAEAIQRNQLKIIPSFKKKEILNLIKNDLQDISVSRPVTSLDWGIPVPGDKSQTIYVWIDALTNYISALGYGSQETDRLTNYWPAEVQLIGKDILRFHALIWPALLMAIGLELPKTLLVHGFITSKGQKMSKSLGNIIDPLKILKKYDSDALRYYLLKEIPLTEDGDFTLEKFKKIYNADLASGLGNSTARILTMVEKYCQGKIPHLKQEDNVSFLKNHQGIYNYQAAQKDIQKAMEEYQFNKALNSIWRFLSEVDKYIEEKKPWELFKNKKQAKLNQVIYELLNSLRYIAKEIYPFLPKTALKIFSVFNIQDPLSFQELRQGQKIKCLDPLFPRLDE